MWSGPRPLVEWRTLKEREQALHTQEYQLTFGYGRGRRLMGYSRHSAPWQLTFGAAFRDWWDAIGQVYIPVVAIGLGGHLAGWWDVTVLLLLAGAALVAWPLLLLFADFGVRRDIAKALRRYEQALQQLPDEVPWHFCHRCEFPELSIDVYQRPQTTTTEPR
jgi:hypothetical protein